MITACRQGGIDLILTKSLYRFALNTVDGQEVLSYAMDRSEHCPFMESKAFCSNCKVHCYRPEMREKIRDVMRFSGPRMLFYHPVLAVSHMLSTLKERMKKT